jgi:hypothetical protein
MRVSGSGFSSSATLRSGDGGLHRLFGWRRPLPANEVVEAQAKNAREGVDAANAGIVPKPSFDVAHVARGAAGELRELRPGQLTELPGVLQSGRKAHQDTSVSIDTTVVKSLSFTRSQPVAATIVLMSRAAEKPLPPPPSGSVWERVERARQEQGLNYSEISLLAEHSTRHYRGLAHRKWGAKGKTEAAYVKALVDLGWSREWLLLGTGKERSDGKVLSVAERRPPGPDELRKMRWRAIEELVEKDGVEIERAKRLVDRVRLFPHAELSWGDYHSEARTMARAEDAKAAEKARSKKNPGA